MTLPGRGANYCDQRFCLCAYLSKPHLQISQNFLDMLPVAMAPLSSV